MTEPSPAQPPGSLNLYRLFQTGMFVFYAGFVVLGVWATLSAPASGDQASARIMGPVIAGVGLLCVALTAASFFLPRKPWAWSVHLVLIVLGIVGAVTTPCALFVALAWFRKDTLAWFGQELSAAKGEAAEEG